MAGKTIAIRAKWPDGIVMMFGTSYRTWNDQLREYCRSFKRPAPTIEVADVAWIGFGGLKWCAWEEFQVELEKEGKGRRAADFKFRSPNRIEACQIRKLLS